MSIDTEIKGEPGSIRSSASWLSGSLATGISGASTAATSAAGMGDWSGRTADVAKAWAGRTASQADQLKSVATRTATILTTFATALQSAQDDMEKICSDARDAELDVAGHVIADPGAGPGKPAPLPRGGSGLKLSGASVAAHAGAMAAYELHRKKVEAYQQASRKAQAVRTRIDQAAAALQSPPQADGFDWGTFSVDLGIGAVLGHTGAQFSRLDKLARSYADRSRLARGELGRNVPTSQLDELARRDGKVMDDILKSRRAADLARKADVAAKGAGGVFAVLGTVNDMKSGESATQAVASNGGGLLASMGAGAGMGALGGSIGGPPGALIGGVGGAIAGAGASILSSNLIDGMFEGKGVGGTLADGAKYVYDHPVLAAPVAPALAGGKFALDHVDDVAEGAKDLADGAVDTARKVPVVGGVMKGLGL